MAGPRPPLSLSFYWVTSRRASTIGCSLISSTIGATGRSYTKAAVAELPKGKWLAATGL